VKKNASSSFRRVQQGRRGAGVGLPECHWPGRGYSAICKSLAITCERCRREYQSIDPDECEICKPENLSPVAFTFKLPAITLQLIKQNHGNVSKYLRELIARDLGADAVPLDLLDRRKLRETSDLDSYLEPSRPKSKSKRQNGGKKNANGSGDYCKVGRILAAKKKTNQS
jgi:hypothetical protein